MCPLHWARGAAQSRRGASRSGRRKGDRDLLSSVAATEQLLEERARERVPLKWAQTKKNLDVVLALLRDQP